MGDGTASDTTRAITRMWPLLQKLGRTRDEYTRASDPAARPALARRLADLADELRGLAAEVVREAGGGPAG